MGSVIVVSIGSSVATQTYPKITVTTRATGRPLQRDMESARPASSATLGTYTTSWDAIRFRIEQTNLERFNDQFNVGWGPIGKWSGSQWQGAEKAFNASAILVAQCVMNGPKRAVW